MGLKIIDRSKGRVLLCGPIPSPTGGVSIHIARLRDILVRGGYEVGVCDESPHIKKSTINIRSLNFLKYFELMRQCNVVHIHSSVDLFRLLHIGSAALFRKDIILTLHSWRKGPMATRVWAYIFNRLSKKVICVNEEIAKRLCLRQDISLIYPAFIPPTQALKALPFNIEQFIAEAKLLGKRIACTNAFRLVEHEGQDLYGMDICLEAFNNPEISSSCVLVCSISDPTSNPRKVQDLISYIQRYDLGNSVHLHLGAIDYCSLLKRSDLSIRATNTDGDALSIRESIYFGTPCIASDCTRRPTNTVLFKSRDTRSLSEAIVKTLQGASSDKVIAEDASKEEFYGRLYFSKR